MTKEERLNIGQTNVRGKATRRGNVAGQGNTKGMLLLLKRSRLDIAERKLSRNATGQPWPKSSGRHLWKHELRENVQTMLQQTATNQSSSNYIDSTASTSTAARAAIYGQHQLSQYPPPQHRAYSLSKLLKEHSEPASKHVSYTCKSSQYADTKGLI